MSRSISGLNGTPGDLDRIDIEERSSAGPEPATGRAAIEVVNGRLSTRIEGEAAKPYAFQGESAGGGNRTRGTYAARPGSPSVGDVYEVSDVDATELRCFSAGTWEVYFRGNRVTPVSAATLSQSHNMANAVWEGFGPYAILRQTAVGGNSFFGQTKNRFQMGNGRVVEAGFFSTGGFGLAALYNNNTSILWGDGDGATAEQRVTAFGTSYTFFGNQYVRAGGYLLGPVYHRIIFFTNDLAYEHSYDGVTWWRRYQAPFFGGEANFDRVGFGGWSNNTGHVRSGVLFHFREYVL